MTKVLGTLTGQAKNGQVIELRARAGARHVEMPSTEPVLGVPQLLTGVDFLP